jgi:uncharacterized protein (TIGR00251 family)
MKDTVDDLFEVSGDDAVVIAVHVLPGAGRSAVTGRHGTALKVRVAAPPEGGRANKASAELLAETFGVKPADVELISGEKSRSKRFRLGRVDVDAFRKRLTQVVDEGALGAGPAPLR